MVTLLLFLYLLGASSFQSISHTHQAVVLHTELQETDPCHIASYHLEREGGCQHDSHITREDKCNLCQVLLHNVQVLEDNTITLPWNFFVVPTPNSLALHANGVHFQSTGRAPPLV